MKFVVATLFAICNVQAVDEQPKSLDEAMKDANKAMAGASEAMACLKIKDLTEMAACTKKYSSKDNSNSSSRSSDAYKNARAARDNFKSALRSLYSVVGIMLRISSN